MKVGDIIIIPKIEPNYQQFAVATVDERGYWFENETKADLNGWENFLGNIVGVHNVKIYSYSDKTLDKSQLKLYPRSIFKLGHTRFNDFLCQQGYL
jgi:hypothetical protein